MGFLKRIFRYIDIGRRLILNLVFIIFIFFIAASFFFPFQEYKKPFNKTLTFLPSQISETTNNEVFLFNADSYELNLFEVISTLQIASSDKNIENIFIDLSNFSASYTGILEIGEAFETVKENGKRIIIYSDFYDSKKYLLASYGDEILLNDNGILFTEGFKIEKIFLKNLLNKLKIDVTTYIAGSYKSALETFTRDSFSENDKYQNSIFINDIWSNWIKIIEKNRNSYLKVPFKDFMERFGDYSIEYKGDISKMVKDLGLIDKTLSRTELYDYISKIDDNQNKKLATRDSFINYSKNIKENSSLNKIAVLTASGEIIDGEYNEGSISSNNFSRVLANIGEDNSIKALFLRINSPGGSGFASEVIRQQLNDLGKKIPVLISFSDISASGGYWIAMNQNKIIASPFTLTGSIGVWAVIPNFEEAFNSIGIAFDQISTSSLNLSILEPPSDNLSKFMQSYVEGSYTKFIDLVSKERGLKINETKSLAEGRIWSGNQALRNRLIDEISSYQNGIDYLIKKANLKDYKIELISTSPGIVDEIASFINSFISSSFYGLKSLPFIKSDSKKNKQLDTKLLCIECLFISRNNQLFK